MLVQSSSPMARISKLQITTTSPLFSGEVGQGYLFAFNAINGILPYTWSTSGPIPAGMILNPSTGALMGTPSASFSNVFPVTVMDALGSTATANFGLTIVSALSITTTSPLTAAIQGVLYSNTFAESGGIPPFVWSFNGAPTGSNTWGLSGPTLSGTPANAETDIIPVRVTDSLGALAQGNFSLTVQAVQAAIPTFSPPGGTFSGPTLVSMACTTPGNTIFYTTNGSTPTTASTQYSTPVLVSATETIKAIAIAAGFTQSAVGSATYTINAIPAASQFKFNPGDYVQGNGATAANLNSAVAPFVGGVNATFIGIAPWYYWDALEQTTLGTYDFSQIITDFNAWQAAVAANGNAGAVGHFIPMVGDYHNSALTPAGLPTYNPRFGGIPQYILNNPATYGSMPNNGFGGWIPTSWNGTTWGFQRAALWRAAVTARRNALAQALAATSFTTTAGPYSGQTFTFDNHPLIEMYADFSPTDLGTIQSSPDIPADYTFPAWNNSFLNRVGPNTGFTKTITALMPGFGGNDFLGHNDPTAQGALVAAMVASPTAQSCTDVFANGALTFAQSYLTGLTWNGSAFVPGGTDYRGHIDSSPSIQGFDYANQLGSNTANTAATVTVIANQCVNTLKSNRRLWAAVNSTGAYVPSYFTSVIQPGVKAALPCITLLPTCEMFAPAGLTGSASGTTVSLSWTTYTGVGTGLSYNIYDSGTLVGNSASGTLILTGVSVGAHNYTVGMVNANGTGAQSAPFSVTVGIVNPVGMNLFGVSYFSTQLPFINLFKSAGRSQGGTTDGLTGWITRSSSTLDTNEAGYLQLDSDGYPTSLIANPIPAGGQKFTSVFCLFGVGMPGVIGVSAPYPSGTYRLQFTGTGTMVISGDGAITLSNAGTGTVSNTFTITASSGMFINITSTTAEPNNVRNVSIVPQSQVAAFDAGAIFSPAFLAACANLPTQRFMDWQNANAKYLFTGITPGAGARSVPLGTVWNYPSGTYKGYFADGSTQNCTLTIGSATCSWPVALGATTGIFCIELPSISWAARSLPSNAFWSLNAGVPFEICAALSNQLNAHCWLPLPLTADDTYISNVSALMRSGTGAQAGFSGLNSNLNYYPELSNEVWNPGFAQYFVAGYLGGGVWPAQSPGGGNFEWNRNWYGMRCATKAKLEQTAWGVDFGRCFPILGGQAASTFSATEALAAPYWTTGTGAPSTYPIKGVAIAPYFGDYLSQADTNVMTAQADGGLSYAFQTLSSNTASGGSNPGYVFGTANMPFNGVPLPSTGFLGLNNSHIQAHVSAMSAYPGMKLMAYEGGQNFLAGGSLPTGWATLWEAAQIDARMGTAYTTYLNYWKTNVGGTQANINCLFTDFQARSINSWGILESVQQTISPLTSAPVKYQAVQNFALGH